MIYDYRYFTLGRVAVSVHLTIIQLRIVYYKSNNTTITLPLPIVPELGFCDATMKCGQ